MTPDLITVERFRQLPDERDCCCELHLGKIAPVPWQKMGEVKLRRRLSDVLQPKLAEFGEVGVRFPFRPISEFDLRVADVAAISHRRFDAIDPNVDVFGAPELFVQLLSPSNTRAKIRETVSLCLANGALECWVVDRKKKSVTVARKDGTTTLYTGDAAIPLTAFGGNSLFLADIFA